MISESAEPTARQTSGSAIEDALDDGRVLGRSGDWAPGDVAAMVANPFYAINIDEGLALPHEPLISEDDWVRANIGLIKELGPEAYLHNLLSILKGNYPRS